MLPVSAGERAAVPIPPPPETEWYHGRLDRYSAEQRLKTAYKLGSYLGKENFINIYASNVRLMLSSFASVRSLENAVRESDRKPGSYVLSYLGKTGINHFR